MAYSTIKNIPSGSGYFHKIKKFKKDFLFNYFYYICKTILNKNKMREHLKQIDKNDIAGAILISTFAYVTYYVIYFIQHI